MSTFRFALALTVATLLPSAARAQLRDVQDNGWSTLKDAYSIVTSMKDKKSERTRANFSSALDKTTSSMVKMQGYIEKMGDKVADEDKSYVKDLRENILKQWKEVAVAQDKLKRAYEPNADKPEKLAEIEDEITNLKKAMEDYELSVSVAFKNYKARWEEIKDTKAKVEDEFKALRQKLKELEEKERAYDKEITALDAEFDKANEEDEKISKAMNDMANLKIAASERYTKAWNEYKVEECIRIKEEMKKYGEPSEKLVQLRIAVISKRNDLNDKMWDKEKERDKVVKEHTAYMKVLDKLDKPLTVLQRMSLWDAEFPAPKMSFQSLR